MPPTSKRDDRGEFYASTYDQSVAYWRGEVEFYRDLAETAAGRGEDVLEIACGTGRITLELAGIASAVVGLDISSAMLNVARVKASGMPGLSWVEADMRWFDLDHRFGLVIIPGHSFQNLNTPEDQCSCLESIKKHLLPDGLLAIHLDHQDVDWLGELMGDLGGRFESAEEFAHPESGRRVQASRAWWYERSSQTATVQTIWEVHGEDGEVIDRVGSGRIGIHCVFPFEMKHLLARQGFQEVAVYGDFLKNPFQEQSSEMIWVASLV